MEGTLTQRYVDGILEATGLLKKGRLNPKGLEAIRRMEDKQTMTFADTLWEQVQDHYKRNLPSILKEITGENKKGPQQKGIYYGSPSPIWVGREPPDLFLRKAALYYDKLILPDALEAIFSVREAYTPKGLRESLSDYIKEWLLLKPWVDMGLVESIPLLERVWEGIRPAIERLINEDWMNEGWRLQALRHEDFGQEGEDLIKFYETLLQVTTPEEVIRRGGGLREFVLKTIVQGSSGDVGSGVFGVGLLGGGCAPITDLRHAWRLLGFWLRCRVDLVVRGGLLNRDYAERWRAGAALLNLEAPKLGFLLGLKPSQIGELRASDEYRFQDFRRKWAEICGQLKRMPWEPDFKKEANQLWEEKIVPEVKRIRKDLATVEVKFGAKASLASLKIITTILDDLTFWGLTKAILEALVAGFTLSDTWKRLKEIKTDNKNDTYFLLEAERKAIDYSRI